MHTEKPQLDEKRQANIVILLAILTALLIWTWGLRPFRVHGLSMYPTFNAEIVAGEQSAWGDYLFLDLFSYTLGEPKRFDVVVARGIPPRQQPYLLKRVIGLPGDTIILTEKNISVIDNTTGEEYLLKESYVQDKENITYRAKTVELGDNEFYLLGDNRNNSYDSRFIGAVPRERLLGKVLVRILPLESFTFSPGRVNPELQLSSVDQSNG